MVRDTYKNLQQALKSMIKYYRYFVKIKVCLHSSICQVRQFQAIQIIRGWKHGYFLMSLMQIFHRACFVFCKTLYSGTTLYLFSWNMLFLLMMYFWNAFTLIGYSLLLYILLIVSIVWYLLRKTSNWSFRFIVRIRELLTWLEAKIAIKNIRY